VEIASTTLSYQYKIQIPMFEKSPAEKAYLKKVIEDMNAPSCNHVYNYYWHNGKCKGSKCILCNHIDKKIKPKIR
jgi:hypothetical protein